MNQRKLLITNVVYGSVYANIFLNQHLKSLLDSTNIPEVGERVEYAIYTDTETLKFIEAHPNWNELKRYCKTQTFTFDWHGVINRFEKRYGILAATFNLGVKLALEKEMYAACWVADLVFAKHFLPKMFQKLDEGYDSVFTIPVRSAFEAIGPKLNQTPGAQFAHDLFDLAYENLHPLWVACHWEAAQFTKLPYTLIWNSGTGLLAHSFSITPIVFTPSEEIAATNHVIDVEVPSLCKNPYWAQDWVDAPVIGVEPLFCYYPPFSNKVATPEWVEKWAQRTVHKTQFSTLRKQLFFPSREVVKMDVVTEADALSVIDLIQPPKEE